MGSVHMCLYGCGEGITLYISRVRYYMRNVIRLLSNPTRLKQRDKARTRSSRAMLVRLRSPPEMPRKSTFPMRWSAHRVSDSSSNTLSPFLSGAAVRA